MCTFDKPSQILRKKQTQSTGFINNAVLFGICKCQTTVELREFKVALIIFRHVDTPL